jgi:hypothetical protein
MLPTRWDEGPEKGTALEGSEEVGVGEVEENAARYT